MDIMGSSGVEVEFDTGRPRVDETKIQASKAKERLNNALLEAWALKSDLYENNQVLKLLLERARDRLLELWQNDEKCQFIDEMIRTIRKDMEYKVILAEKVAKRNFGPELLQIVEK